ncbi:AP2 ERF domain-containing transcription factor [Musa troglodytarum]|uniref:AP2 ERF domain-containing transcription factor n=1 Tax=Musa troglodytarum TaxID=320322 RepID=A0A9E7JPJ8_9LILI|nr:AP2 ERF domain-containing transcription factor [Musa troglodytarum]
MEFEESSSSSSSGSSSSYSCFSSTLTASGAPITSRKRKGGRKKFRETRHPVYHGVRERNGGRWVCEVREPRKKSRIWLGTFRAPEMAALAHDAAAITLRGESALLNFPDLAGTLPRAQSPAPEDVRRAATEAVEMFRPSKPTPAPLPAVSDAGGSQGRKERKENATTEDAAAPPAAVFVDEDELFNMPELMEDMARGLLLTPPALQRRGFDWDIAVEEEQDIDLSPLWNDE